MSNGRTGLTMAHLVMRLRSSHRTDLQSVALDALHEFGPLTVRELSDGLGYASTRPVARAFENLHAEGAVTRRRESRRELGPGAHPYRYALPES